MPKGGTYGNDVYLVLRNISNIIKVDSINKAKESKMKMNRILSIIISFVIIINGCKSVQAQLQIVPAFLPAR